MTEAREPQTSGLQLPTDVGVPQTVANEIANEWDTLPYVDARLREAGMSAAKEPNLAWEPVTAAQLLSPDITSFTTIFASQLHWYNHVVRVVADIRAELLQVENQMSDIERVKRGEFRAINESRKKVDRMSAQEMADNVDGDETYRILKVRKQELSQMKLKADAWAEELDRSYKTVSRQIENRKAENQAGNREANMPGHARGRWETGR